VLDVIDAFALDFNLGNAIRFVLEKDDGDALQNLREAHIYLERAIARLEASSR
jgi:regulator of PEP synthase PpsR (kinase-PPPase family)